MAERRSTKQRVVAARVRSPGELQPDAEIKHKKIINHIILVAMQMKQTSNDLYLYSSSRYYKVSRVIREFWILSRRVEIIRHVCGGVFLVFLNRHRRCLPRHSRVRE